MRSLVILPTYDEAENVISLAREILRSSADLSVLVVDDGSPDGTGDLVAAESLHEPRVSLIRRGRKLGLGSAYLAGFRFALDHGFERILTMDCDFSHDPKHLPAILAMSAHRDVVIGSRYVPGGGIANWPWYRRALSSFANAYTRSLLRLPVRDCTSGYRCYRRDVIEAVDPFDTRASGYSFLEEMVDRVHQSGFSIGEVPIVFEDRRRGASKISEAEIFLAAWHVLGTAWRRRFGGAGGNPQRGA